MFFNKEGILNLDEAVANTASFKNIMADGVVTDEELKTQAENVVSMLHDMEKKFSQEQLVEIKKLLTETAVLYTAYNIHSIQSLNI